MSRYIVHILAPDGAWGYLSHGKRVRIENASRYPHPANARQAADGYRRKWGAKGAPSVAEVMDTRYMCRRCEYDFSENKDFNADGCDDYHCPCKARAALAATEGK